MSETTLETQFDRLEKLYREDHDVTVRLDTKFDAFVSENRQNQKSYEALVKTVNRHSDEIKALQTEDKARKDINIDRANRRHDINVVLGTTGSIVMALVAIFSLLVSMKVIK